MPLHKCQKHQTWQECIFIVGMYLHIHSLQLTWQGMQSSLIKFITNTNVLNLVMNIQRLKKVVVVGKLVCLIILWLVTRANHKSNS